MAEVRNRPVSVREDDAGALDRLAQLGSIADRNERLEALSRIVRDHLGAADHTVAVMLSSPDGEWLDENVMSGPTAEHEQLMRPMLHDRIRVGENATSTALLSGRPVVVPSIDPQVYRAGAIARFRPYFDRWPAYGTVAVPLPGALRSLGLLLVIRHMPDDPIDDETVAWLEGAAALAGATLDASEGRPSAEAPARTRPLGLLADAIAVLVPLALAALIVQAPDPTTWRPTLVYLVLVVIVAGVLGARAAFITTGVSALAMAWAIYPDQWTFDKRDHGTWLGVSLFVAAAVVVVLVIDRVLRRQRERFDDERLVSETRTQELQRRLELVERQALSDSRFRSLVEATSSITWLTDGSHSIVVPQGAWADFTGQPWDAHQGTGWLEMVVEDDRPAVVASLLTARDRTEPLEVSTRVWSARHHEHRHVDLRAAPIRDRHGSVVEWIVTLADVHERHVLLADLDEAQARLRAIQDGNVLAFLFGTEDRITDANDAFLELTGRTREELESGSLRWPDLTPPEWTALDEQAVSDLIRTGRCEPFEKEYVHRDGHRIPIELGIVALHRQPLRWAAYIVDLSERKAAEDRLREAYRQRDHVARTLQTSLLPPTLPEPPGLELAARYLPSPVGEGVGGDFYDVHQSHDGSWHLVIGDVCGRGPDAAALTALTRYTLRAAAIHESDPAEILAVLNDAILRSVDDGRFCTVAYAVLQPTGDHRWRATLTLGGHHPLRLVHGSSVRPVGEPGALLGIFDRPKLTSTTFDLELGDQLIAFTDGLIEQHEPPFDDRDLDVLLEHSAAVGAGLDEVVRAIEARVAPEPVREDDTAILAVEVR
jgi:sigma-B regulation protein RsbU (phosphoserine phosphatase)